MLLARTPDERLGRKRVSTVPPQFEQHPGLNPKLHSTQGLKPTRCIGRTWPENLSLAPAEDETDSCPTMRHCHLNIGLIGVWVNPNLLEPGGVPWVILVHGQYHAYLMRGFPRFVFVLHCYTLHPAGPCRTTSESPDKTKADIPGNRCGCCSSKLQLSKALRGYLF